MQRRRILAPRVRRCADAFNRLHRSSATRTPSTASEGAQGGPFHLGRPASRFNYFFEGLTVCLYVVEGLLFNCFSVTN